jgi:hypothetical protein
MIEREREREKERMRGIKPTSQGNLGNYMKQ